MSIEPFNREFFGQPLMYQKVNDTNLMIVESLHRMVLPTVFSSPFFKNMVEPESRSFLVLLREKPIGFICFKSKTSCVLYLQSFGLLPVYRGAGIGSVIFNFMIKLMSTELDTKQIELHVQESNVKAVRFYQKFGFKIVNRLEKYYRRHENPAALYLVLDL